MLKKLFFTLFKSRSKYFTVFGAKGYISWCGMGLGNFWKLGFEFSRPWCYYEDRQSCLSITLFGLYAYIKLPFIPIKRVDEPPSCIDEYAGYGFHFAFREAVVHDDFPLLTIRLGPGRSPWYIYGPWQRGSIREPWEVLFELPTQKDRHIGALNTKTDITVRAMRGRAPLIWFRWLPILDKTVYRYEAEFSPDVGPKGTSSRSGPLEKMDIQLFWNEPSLVSYLIHQWDMNAKKTGRW